MAALAIILGIIILIMLLRFGVRVVFGAGGLIVTANAGFIPVRIYPRGETARKEKKKPVKPAEKKEKARSKRKRKAAVSGEEEPGPIESFLEIMSALGNILNRLRKRLLIKRLKLLYVFAGDDPMKTALSYGRATAVVNAVIPALEKNFRIRRCDITPSADFIGDKPRIFVDAAISLAVWESLYILLAAIPVIKTLKRQKTASGKDGHENGQTSDQ